MKRMRKCNDELYQLAMNQALVKKLKYKKCRPFCLCPPDVMFVTRGSKNFLFYVFDSYSNLDCGQWYKLWIWQVIQWVPRRHKVLTHGQERLFCKVTSVSIHSFVEWLDPFSYILRPADVTVKEVNHILM